MKITSVDAFQMSWEDGDTPEQRSAFVIVRYRCGPERIGEASPMQGGIASLGIINANLAPMIVGRIRWITRSCLTWPCIPLSNWVPKVR